MVVGCREVLGLESLQCSQETRVFFFILHVGVMPCSFRRASAVMSCDPTSAPGAEQSKGRSCLRLRARHSERLSKYCRVTIVIWDWSGTEKVPPKEQIPQENCDLQIRFHTLSQTLTPHAYRTHRASPGVDVRDKHINARRCEELGGCTWVTPPGLSLHYHLSRGDMNISIMWQHQTTSAPLLSQGDPEPRAFQNALTYALASVSCIRQTMADTWQSKQLIWRNRWSNHMGWFFRTLMN